MEKFTFNPRDGVDNPAMEALDDADSPSAPSPRLCVLQRQEGDAYGFRLRVERGRLGHIVRHVVAGGAAASGGLRDGDRLLEVNGCYVNDLPHPEVASKIRLSGNPLRLLVLDGEAYDQALYQGRDLQTVAGASGGDGCRPPRLCHVTRDPGSGLGVSFTPADGVKGRFSVSPVSGGAAERAGVRKGDLLVWMNGATVSELTHAALSRMVKKCRDDITILVVDRQSEQHYVQRGIPILPSNAVPLGLPHTPRTRQLLSGSAGFGFTLQLEKAASGLTYHVLRELESGGPAERAGLEDGELLLEVNGEAVEPLGLQEIVGRVRRSGQRLSITTITPQGLQFYTKLGLSPLLFSGRRDVSSAAEQQEETETEAPSVSRL